MTSIWAGSFSPPLGSTCGLDGTEGRTEFFPADSLLAQTAPMSLPDHGQQISEGFLQKEVIWDLEPIP